jgi:hypothetical protein
MRKEELCCQDRMEDVSFDAYMGKQSVTAS